MELERLRAEKMDVDGASPALAEDIPTCGASLFSAAAFHPLTHRQMLLSRPHRPFSRRATIVTLRVLRWARLPRTSLYGQGLTMAGAVYGSCDRPSIPRQGCLPDDQGIGKCSPDSERRVGKLMTCSLGRPPVSRRNIFLVRYAPLADNSD